MAQDVLCDVNNCHFWQDGNRCGADQIYVVNRSEDMAVTSSGTDCKTFIPSEQYS